MSRRRLRTIAGVALAAGTLSLGICGSASATAPVTVHTLSATAPGGFAPVSLSPACGAREQLVGSGFTTTTTPAVGVLLWAMMPSPTGVTVNAANAAGTPGTLTGTAYCKSTAKKKKKKKKKKGKKKSGASASFHATEAKKKKKKKKKKKTPPPQVVSSAPVAFGTPSGTATVTCPAGTTVRMGGYTTGSDPMAGNLASPNSLQMISPTQWQVTVDKYGPDGNSVTAIALCGTGAPLTTETGPTTNIPFSGQGTSTATCPAGKTVVFGGLFENAFSGTFPNGLARASDTTVTATAYASGGTDKITAIAYCS